MNTKAKLSHTLFGVAFLGAILLGWGFDDVAGYFMNPARLLTFVILALGFLLAAFLMPPSWASEGAADKLVRRQKLAALIATMASLFQHFIAPYSDRRDWLTLADGDGWRYGGFLLYLIGFYYATYAPFYLGRYFSIQATIQQDHRLITTGPFKRIRHPRYAGVILMAFGFALVYRSAAGLVNAVAMTALMLWRMSDEEKMLSGHFQVEWTDYSRRTKRLLPFIY
ncbi:MAG: methyltransferase family protein [Blastocatellia bacterium]